MSDVSNHPPAPAKEEYPRRLTRHAEAVVVGKARVDRIGNLRLLTFFAAIAVLVFALMGTISAHVLWLPLAAFVWLLIQSGRESLALLYAERGVVIYEHGIARLEDRWAGTGRTGEDIAPADHVYADDLDIFGRGSLFELLSRARTGSGERTLAQWLLHGADRDTVIARQDAVRTLAPRVDLREDLLIIGGEVASATDRDRAAAWGPAPRVLSGTLVPCVLGVLGILTVTLLVGWLAFDWPALWFIGAALVQFLAWLPNKRRVEEVLRAAEGPAQDLSLVQRLFARIEREQFQDGLLGELARGFETGDEPPSVAIAQLNRLMDIVEARQNPFFLPISWLVSTGTQMAYAVERWRADHGTHLATWVESLGAFEALLSLSGYAYEHPDDVFPDVVEGPPRFEGADLGHPLLPQATCVRNDAVLVLEGDEPQALLVSGSNMSGKSTYLRTVGVAVVMGLAGCSVRASALTLTPLDVGASLRISDSLQAGASRFYAEIERLKQIVDLAGGDVPALFLLDEILHGTNSHDRRIGAEAVIRALLERGAIGLVTTHDLALAEIAGSTPQLANVHFSDTFVDGQIVFDYRVRPGVVQGSNALDLMRSIGLDV